MSLDALLAEVRSKECPHIVFTGGEPLLQLSEEVVSSFKAAGFYVAIETNGTLRPPLGIDYVAVSPKIAEHVLAQNFKDVHIDELRYVRNRSQGIPKPLVKADHYYVSPEFHGEYAVQENIDHCIDLVKTNPTWKLSLQEHKLLKIR
jgi:7-carboxy-7-deazaguanine synthase